MNTNSGGKVQSRGNGYLFVYGRRSQIASNQQHYNGSAELSEASQEPTLNTSRSGRSGLSPEVRKELGRAHAYLLTFKKHFFYQGFFTNLRFSGKMRHRYMFPRGFPYLGRLLREGDLRSWPLALLALPNLISPHLL